MATTSAACRNIIITAGAAEVDLQVSFMHRYFDEVQAASGLLAAHAFGEVTSTRIGNATPRPDWERLIL
jgi:predicted dehydrogenase